MPTSKPAPLRALIKDPADRLMDEAAALAEQLEQGALSVHVRRSSQPDLQNPQPHPGAHALRGIYIASRASIPARAAQWRLLRDIKGWHIVSSWIDEDEAGATADFSELWLRIEAEIKQSERLILYVEPDDFPLKGALVEVGIALAAGVKVLVVAPGIVLDERTRRPIGSWVDHPLVKLVPNMDVALRGAARRAPEINEGA